MKYKYIFLIDDKIQISQNKMPLHVYSDNPDWRKSKLYLNSPHYNEWILNLRAVNFKNEYDLHKIKEYIIKSNSMRFVPEKHSELFEKGIGIDVSQIVDLEYDSHYENILAYFTGKPSKSDYLKDNLKLQENKVKTPMQELIDFAINKFGSDSDVANLIICEAMILKKKEKKHIIDASLQGFHDGQDYAATGTGQYKNSEEYYNKTYN